jgi:hypothetical protein
MGALWRHISSPELDIDLATLESGGIIAGVDRAGKTVYRAIPQTLPSQPQAKGTTP